MDVDSASSSPSSRLSVVCSASAEYSSNSSEGSSPNSRRNSMNESVIKDEHYWERRRRNNDASRRSREKRRMNDLAMEEKILLLKAENERLKSQLLDNRDKPPTVQQLEPPSSIVIPDASIAKNLFPPTAAGNPVASMISVPLLQAAAPHFPMLQLCHLQPSLQSPIYPTAHQSTSASTSTSIPSFSSSTSAFHPFRPSESTTSSSSDSSFSVNSLAPSTSSVIMKVERRSPDSSTGNDPMPIREIQIQPQVGSNVIQRVGSPSVHQQGVVVQNLNQQQQGPSLLSALLSQRRPSPTVPQSRTEHISGLTSPPRVRHGSSKSDCESVSSSASLSPSHSSEDHSNYSNKSPQYVDRRRRNNEAAKRCRANRRAVFDYRSRRVQLLEGENDDLCRQIETLKAEIAHFKSILAQRATAAQP